MDVDGYPEESELETITKWDPMDFQGLMDYVHDIWWMKYWGWKYDEVSGMYRISTGGWSGNESLVYAMQANSVWWALHWQLSKRGGHYEFKGYQFMPSESPDIKQDSQHSK